MKNIHSNKNFKTKFDLSSDFNSKLDLILQNTEISNKQKKKSLKLYDNNDMEYYDKFLKNLHKDKNIPIKNTRRKKSKSLKITKEEENKISSSINDNNKKIKNLMKKSYLKKQNHFLFNVKTQKSDSSSILPKVNQKNSFQMINNIQFSIEESKKKKSFSNFKNQNNDKYNDNIKNKEEIKNFELTNDNITLIENPEVFLTYINQINLIEKIFENKKNLIKNKTFSYSKNIKKKRGKEIIENINIEKIIPIQSVCSSNATKIDFSKKNSFQENSKENNTLKKKENDENININETQKNTQIINTYKLNDNSNKKKKILFCCCLPIKG